MTVDPADWQRLNLLIAQATAEVTTWTFATLEAERAWHRGLREVDRRHLSPDGTVLYEAMADLREVHRLDAPESRLAAAESHLAHLKSLRTAMLEATR